MSSQNLIHIIKSGIHIELVIPLLSHALFQQIPDKEHITIELFINFCERVLLLLRNGNRKSSDIIRNFFPTENIKRKDILKGTEKKRNKFRLILDSCIVCIYYLLIINDEIDNPFLTDFEDIIKACDTKSSFYHKSLFMPFRDDNVHLISIDSRETLINYANIFSILNNLDIPKRDWYIDVASIIIDGNEDKCLGSAQSLHICCIDVIFQGMANITPKRNKRKQLAVNALLELSHISSVPLKRCRTEDEPLVQTLVELSFMSKKYYDIND